MGMRWWRWLVSFRGPLVTLIVAVALAAALRAFAPPESLAPGLHLGVKLLALFGAGWLVIRCVDVASDLLAALFNRRNDAFAVTLVPVFKRILKPIVGLLVLLVALQNLGLDVGGLLAGLGIGGIALAMAGKPTLENMFGALAIALDRPFRVGDFIKVGDVLGGVEEVGLRSTRIRTLDRTVVTLPNSTLSVTQVENFSVRDRIRLNMVVGVAFSTPPDHFRNAIEAVKSLLGADERIWPDAIVVRFIGFGPSAYQMEIVCWVLVTDFGVFTGIREELLFAIRRTLEQEGVTPAFPTQTVVMEGRAEPRTSPSAGRAAPDAAG